MKGSADKANPAKIVSLYTFYPEDYQAQRFCCGLDPSQYQFHMMIKGSSKEQVHELVEGSHTILAVPMSPYIDRAMLEAANGVKLIQFLSVGYDRIDLEAATEMGVSVANNAGINAVAVAEHAFMMILVLLKKAFIGHDSVRRGNWNQSELVNASQYLRELKGKTLGILGLGSIGTELAKRGVVFEARVLYNKRNRLTPSQEKALGVEYRPFEDLLRESDVLSIHVPLTDETRGMIGAPQLQMMKDNAVLINTARADVVDERALAEALRQGKLGGAGIDVPRGADKVEEFAHMFEGLENVILTPHVASGTYNCANLFWDQAADNIRRAVCGEKPRFLVNDVW